MQFPATLLVTGVLAAGLGLAPLGGAPADGEVRTAVAPVSYRLPPVSGDTLSTMNMINGAMADLGTLSRDPLDSSANSAEVAAAQRRAANMARNSAALEGYVYEQGVRQDVLDYDAQVRAEDAARDYATDTWIDSENSISRSSW
jgi:hypothetical protein